MIRLRIIVLSVLAGATLAVGATAAIAFPAMKALDPTLSTFSAWPDPHWPIAAGDIANRLFRMLDYLTSVCVAVSAFTMIRPRGTPRDRSVARIVCAAAVLGLFAITFANWVWLRPTMHNHLEAYLAAARAGNLEVGRAERAAFGHLHPIATAMLVMQLALALIGAACSRSSSSKRE